MQISQTLAIKKASFLAGALIFPSAARKTADFLAKDGFLYNLSTKTAVFVDKLDQYFSHQRFE